VKRVAILQSNYIPWKGYFDLISRVDLFVFHDDLQYTKQDWRNRNRIKGPGGTRWLTVPCGADESRRICDVELSEPGWQAAHWRRIVASYRRAPFFANFAPELEGFYLGRQWRTLSELNQFLITHIAREWLQLGAEFRDSREFDLTERKAERVLQLLGRTGATHYLSGPAAKAYLDEASFARAGTALEWMTYGPYLEYPQLYPPFEHEVTVLDLLFHTGPDARRYINAEPIER